MKTSYWWYACFFVLGGIAMVAAQNILFVKALGQQPDARFRPADPAALPRTPVVVEHRSVDGIILHTDGTVSQTVGAPTLVVEELADGTVIQRPQYHSQYTPPITAHDPETAKLLQEELEATRAAESTWREFRAAGAEGDKEKIKAQLREKLLAIFELQQKRRAHEVAQIEKRLVKLKETMSKRDSSKDTIVDRRLDSLTGGIDELGWEDTFRPNVSGPADPNLPSPSGLSPTVVPRQPSSAAPGIEFPAPPTAPSAVTPVPGLPGIPGTTLPPPASPTPYTVPRTTTSATDTFDLGPARRK